MSDDPDAPKLARDVAQAQIGYLLFGLRETVNELIKLRVGQDTSDLIADEEGELMAIKQSLDFLLSDIRESRVAASRLRVIK